MGLTTPPLPPGLLLNADGTIGQMLWAVYGGVTFNGKDHPGPNESPGNLLNPTGSGAGTKVTIDQVKQMKEAFDKGRLNYNKQKIIVFKKG